MIQRYAVRKLHCSGCAARIEEALLQLPGVVSASIDLDTSRLRVEGEQPTLDTMSRLADSIEPGAHFAELPATGHDAEVKQTSLFRSEPEIWISALLFVFGLVFGDHVVSMLSPQHGGEMLAAVVGFSVDMLFFGVPYVLCGFPVLRKGFLNIRNGDFFTEYTLMGGATMAAAAIGELPEAVGVMLFYCIGEAVQERAAGNSRRSIKALLAARPSVAHVLVDAEVGGSGQESVRDVAPESLLPGARILVKPGEKIPLDGVVLSGTSQVDTSPLTGEPVPVRIDPGKTVFAGTVNLESALTVEVTALFENSSVARILELVERATANKAPVERFITRFARYYTPAVVLAAALVALLPPLMGMGTFQEWLYRALVLLVISCPCALVISIPLGYFGGIGAASRRGILVKGGHVLDALRGIRTIAFDKTGTLTRGVFEVNQILPAPGVSEQEVLRVAALVESRSTHPIGRSIMLAANPNTSDTSTLNHTWALEPVDVREVPGKGLEGRYRGQLLLVGNSALLTAHGLDMTRCPDNEALLNTEGSVAHVARDGTYLGAIVVSDAIRPESLSAIQRLRGQGISQIVMLTGDRAASAESVARALHLDGYRSGLLPEDKAAALQQFGPEPTILFVGDGINDAPVLALSGVGVAMGGLGSEAAIEVADAVILDDSPSRLPELLHIAARTRSIVWQNIIMALSVKGVFMGLGIVGLSGLWEAVFADVGVALLAVLNASRTMK